MIKKTKLVMRACSCLIATSHMNEELESRGERRDLELGENWDPLFISPYSEGDSSHSVM